MAEIYSLICFGGKDGKTVTFTDVGDIVNLTSHGLRNGKGVIFTTTGSLPTGITASTTYYIREGADANKFTLYPTYADAIANTNQITFTGTGTGTHTVRGAYFNSLTTEQKARYGSSGSERIYDSLKSWITGRASASALDYEICEIGEDWIDIISTVATVTVPCGGYKITTYVNGTRSSGYHNGILDSGYILKQTGANQSVLNMNIANGTVDGFIVWYSYANYSQVCIAVSYKSMAINMICKGPVGYGTGISMAATSYAINCLCYNLSSGFSLPGYNIGIFIANCTATKNGNGFTGVTYQPLQAYLYNNIAVGNTTNWVSGTYGFLYATNNAGLSGEAWITGTNPRITIATTDFLDWTNNNFRAATSSSPQVDSGVEFYGALPYDIADDLRPNYNNGGSEAYDVGCFEYDNGYGLPPQSQPVLITGIIDGTRVKIAKTSDGTELYNSVLSGTTQVSYTEDMAENTAVKIYLRKGSSATYYHPLELTGTIDVESGLTLSTSGLQAEDIAAHDYTSTSVATDWTFNSGTGAITHTSGTTRYSVQDLYSWHQDYYDDSSTVDDIVLMYGITPNIFQLINSGNISDSDLEDLTGGSIEFENGTLWSNLWTTGTLTGNPTVYILQNGSKYTPFWSSGHIDILLKVSNSGTLIDSGIVTAYVRKWGYTYDNYEIDLSSGGRNVAPINTFTDSAITETTTTVSGWTDITVTFGTYSEDFGDGDGLQTYYCKINCNNRPLSEVYQYMQYLTREDSTATLNGVSGWKYSSAHTGYIPNKSAPFGTYSGGIWALAKGIWLDNVPSGDLTNYILTDDAGNTHQNTVALNQSVTINGLTIGSRVQIYDITNNTELVNQIASTSTVLWEDPSPPLGDREIRVRIAYISGVTAKEFIEANIGTCGTSSSTKDVSYLASQNNDTVYISNAIDGSTVSECSISPGGIDVYINDLDNSTTFQRIYNWYQYYLFTEDGIRDSTSYILAIDQTNYRISDNGVTPDLIIRNISFSPLEIKNASVLPETSSINPTAILDQIGSNASIFINSPVVVGFSYSSGSGLDITQASQLTTIYNKSLNIVDGKNIATKTDVDNAAIISANLK